MAQYKYSVGDRLRVLWEDAVCDAAVITVNLRDVGDGVYSFLLIPLSYLQNFHR